MLSPVTLPVKASVSGIGLVMEIFHATSSPLTAPSKISPLLPSADCVPVSVPPELFSDSSALRSPIGVLMVMFQFPSTAIVLSLRHRCFAPAMSQHPGGAQEAWGRSRRSGARGADPAGDQNAERDILHGEGRDFGAECDHRDIERPQLDVAGRGHRDHAGA